MFRFYRLDMFFVDFACFLMVFIEIHKKSQNKKTGRDVSRSGEAEVRDFAEPSAHRAVRGALNLGVSFLGVLFPSKTQISQGDV